jgi:hypothetical protein
MKINSKTLADFLKKVTINGSITDGLLKFGQEGLTLTVSDVSKIGAVTGLLKATNFINYSQMAVPVKNMSTLISVLNVMNGNVELSIDRNIFKISSDSNEFDMVMPDEQFLECNLPVLPTLDHDGGFELDATIFTTIKKNTQILNTSKMGVFAEVNNNVFTVRTGEEGFDKLTAKSVVDYKNTSARYGSTLLEFISVIGGRVTISFNDNYPMLITAATPDSTIKWMIAPIIDKESEAEE